MKTGFIACHICNKVHEDVAVPEGYKASCARCGAEFKRKTPWSFHLTAAFTLCALLLYIPANIYPILSMTLYGRETSNTVFSGVVRFYQDGDIFVAVVVFLASILVPLMKILGLLFLVVSTRFHWEGARLWRTRVYRAIDVLGKWAMLDVFALAILISLIKLQRMASVTPGRGVFAFTLVIVFTLLASASFDPHSIWEEEKR
jgi:paraquat-inducible protein A